MSTDIKTIINGNINNNISRIFLLYFFIVSKILQPNEMLINSIINNAK